MTDREFLEEAMQMFADFAGPSGQDEATRERRNVAWQRWSDWRWAVGAHLTGEELNPRIAERRKLARCD